jgi:4-hydroxythreonine-4-phosphate dehydrogenase
MTLPRIGITLGDPGGIGPEIILKAFSGIFVLPAADYVLFGSASALDEEAKTLSLCLPLGSLKAKKVSTGGSFSLRDLGGFGEDIKKGMPSAENGGASFRFFEEAVAEARREALQGIVTAPISKHSWTLAGLSWRGHTDYLSRFYPQAIMAFWSEKIKVALLSHHVSLRGALATVTRRNLFDFFLRLDKSLRRLRPDGFEFLVSGLNPHAGEEGLIGREEIEEIIPAVEDAARSGLRISGPYPPDTVFRNALDRADRVVIALYHDQGLIPFKLEAFQKGVNLTMGLPFIRTSPDHGTAFDIAGKNAASPLSLIEAIKLAAELVARPRDD